MIIYGQENEVRVGGQTIVEMQPRTWYAVAAGDTVQNQHWKPLLFSESDDPLPTTPRETITAFTILMGEKVTFSVDGFILSSHFRNQVISSNCPFATKTLDAPPVGDPKLIDVEVTFGFEKSIMGGMILIGDEVERKTLTYDDGTIEYKFFDSDGNEVTMTNTGFTATKPVSHYLRELAYETLVNGVIEKLSKTTQVLDGVMQPPVFSQFADGSAYTPVNVMRIDPKPQKVQMGLETFDVTGLSTSLPNVPALTNTMGQAFPQHAFVHVEVDSDNTATGISYTTDGTDPAESATAKEMEVSAGNGFELDTNEEIVNFRAVPLDGTGTPDDTLTIQLTVEYNNISEDKDDV